MIHTDINLYFIYSLTKRTGDFLLIKNNFC